MVGTWSRIKVGVVVAIVFGALNVLAASVAAHECVESERPGNGSGQARGHDDGEECHDTPVVGLWRSNLLPVFEMENRDDPETRQEAERWRDEHGCYTQYCLWFDWNSSTVGVIGGGPGSGNQQPNAVHVGMAADHSMTENAHQSEDHGTGEGNHDAHGGAVFADVCVTGEQDTSYESQPGACEGPEDTRVVLVLKEHLSCPTCTDEYYEVRPLDQAYTERQLGRSVSNTEAMVTDPYRYACGEPEHSNCPPESPVPAGSLATASPAR